MKVLLITDNHTACGGAENYFFDLKERLKKIPDVEVYSLGFAAEANMGEDFVTFKSIRSNFFKFLWYTLINPFMYFKLRKQLKRICPDVIHIHNIKQYSISLLWALKPYPVMQTVHDFSCICPTAQNIHKNNEPCPTGLQIKCFWQHQIKYNFLTYLALIPAFYLNKNRLRKTVKKFIAPSPYLVDYLKRNHFDDVTFIPPFKPERDSFSFHNVNSNHFLYSGNLGTHKGVHLLIEEFALACHENPALILYIAGLGPEELQMRHRAKILHIEKNLVFLGWQDNLDHIYQSVTAALFPSIGMEAFGLVMTEAMSHARPVIAINRGTAAWLIENNHTGLLFNPSKKGDLAEKILFLARNQPFTQQLGINGFAKLQALINNEHALKKIIELYKGCLDKQ